MAKDSLNNWAGLGGPYARSFPHLCAGAVEPLLDAAEAVVGSFTGRRVADIGCGTGNVTALALSRGAEVTGVDPDARMLSLALAAAPQAELLVGRLPELPFAADTFDAVVSPSL
ncbi:class I SAM-dependent methyltransferase [Arthrobacter liuii]|uniref:Methyltransferase domain-containing protein n=1 Tax=Arthrobacter liuii TaxID=1476996 RepID=A0ABQ2ASJ7_9MICC|nr:MULTISPECIES: class I SAM-dependent methyltransferase [Micrococcaceae]NUT71942.1 class I SAM-dependent methyltransferase [Pseudarthrobacter sp. C4D7]GGH94671.1 hypothetical protein GCM10007170_18410 [Arthrobacter liuii]